MKPLARIWDSIPISTRGLLCKTTGVTTVIEYTYRRFGLVENQGILRERTMATKKATSTAADTGVNTATETTTENMPENQTENTAVPATVETNASAPAAESTDKMTNSKINSEPSKPVVSNADLLNAAMIELRKPFHPTHVTWKPGALAKGGGKALALAYADLRAYQNRLDEVCGANWAVSYTPWGERIVCNLTIYGVTRSSTGEPDTQSERSEIAGTATEAQAFKRACAMFGLGRYLYNLPSVWAEYDADRKQFTEPAKAKLLSILVQHHRRSQETKNGADDLFAMDEPVEENNVSDALRHEFENMGRELYGAQWDQVRRRNVQRVSAGKARETGELTGEQIQKLIDGMKKLREQRAVA